MIHFFPVMDFLLKFQVIHSLPGRLRIHVPLLKKVPGEWQLEDSVFGEFFMLIPGVRSVSVNYVSANILLLYDKDRSGESEILLWIRRISDRMAKYARGLKTSSPEELVKALRELLPVMQEEIRQEFTSL